MKNKNKNKTLDTEKIFGTTSNIGIHLNLKKSKREIHKTK